MKTLLHQKFILCCITVLIGVFSASAQSKKVAEMKWKNNFISHMKQNRSVKESNQNFGIKINPYWKDINAPHTYNSFVPQIKVPTFNSVWEHIDYDSVPYDANQFLRTADGGKTWRLDSVDAPAGYGLSGIAAIDANTCYAAMYDAFNYGGSMFKTTDGGDTWKQLEPGKLFGANSFPDFVHFFDAQHGVTVGDDDGIDSLRMEIYTTSDAGKTWQRVPKQNIPPAEGYVFSSTFNPYAASRNRIWFDASDSHGNNYFYRSDDFGKTWQQFPYTLATGVYCFAFADKQNGLGVIYGSEGTKEIETQDGGKTWADKSFTGYPMGLFITAIPFTHTFVSTIPYGAEPVSGSSYSNDYGATWKLIDSSSDFNPFAVVFLNPLIGWAGRGHSSDINGGIYKWKYRFSLNNNAADEASTLSITKNEISKAVTLGLYPNPSKDVITINGLHASAKTTLSLFSVSGKLIQQSSSSNESYQFNIQKLAAGSYYVRIQSGEKTTTIKFVKE